MKFIEAVRALLSKSFAGLTPQEIRELIKIEHPQFYGTSAHQINVGKKHYKNLDHALLAQIYVLSNNAADILTDKSVKPMRLFLSESDSDLNEVLDSEDDTLSIENLDKLEAGIGTLYILGTNLFTKDGKEIIKIGITTGQVEDRINQLYNTSVPYRFREIKQFETQNYAELEKAIHKIFDPFRINRSREFFTDDSLEFFDTIVAIHKQIIIKSTHLTC